LEKEHKIIGNVTEMFRNEEKDFSKTFDLSMAKAPCKENAISVGQKLVKTES